MFNNIVQYIYLVYIYGAIILLTMKRTRFKTDLDYNFHKLYMMGKIQCKNI
jgi:hypothetical protein